MAIANNYVTLVKTTNASYNVSLGYWAMHPRKLYTKRLVQAWNFLVLSCKLIGGKLLKLAQVCFHLLYMIQVTSSLVVTSDKINTCSVYTQQAYLRTERVSVAPRPLDQLNEKDVDVMSLPN